MQQNIGLEKFKTQKYRKELSNDLSNLTNISTRGSRNALLKQKNPCETILYGLIVPRMPKIGIIDDLYCGGKHDRSKVTTEYLW